MADRPRTRPGALAITLAIPLGAGWSLVSCGAQPRDDRVRLAVFAASSLTEAFTELEQTFERKHPGVDVQLSFAGSQVLRLQIEQGAPADVFASANATHVEALVDAGLAGPSRVFASNALVVVVPLDNPAAITSFAELDAAERVVLGAPDVPAGIYARAVLDRAQAVLGDDFAASVRAHVVSEETNVRLARAKVELGEADAAIIYASDAAGSERVRVIPIPPELQVEVRYPIAALARSDHPREAEQFIDHVLSARGRERLARHGFVFLSAATPTPGEDE